MEEVPLTIGRSTWLGPRAIVFTHPFAPIVIGENCDIGPDVQFVTGTHKPGTAQRRAGEPTAKEITIGNGCWIGASTLILSGVKVDDGVVVAAGSVVTRSVEANVLVAGVPATKKRALPNP